MEPTVLVVEDDGAIRDMVAKTLARDGWIVETARDGADAVTRAVGGRLDLLVLDLNMPVMDGFDVLRFLAQRVEAARVPVIVLTAHATPAVHAQLADAGVIDVLEKPVRLSVLRAAAQRAIAGRSSDGPHSVSAEPASAAPTSIASASGGPAPRSHGVRPLPAPQRTSGSAAADEIRTPV